MHSQWTEVILTLKETRYLHQRDITFEVYIAYVWLFKTEVLEIYDTDNFKQFYYYWHHSNIWVHSYNDFVFIGDVPMAIIFKVQLLTI